MIDILIKILKMNKKEVKTLKDVVKYYDQVRLIKFKEDVNIKHVQDIFKNTINLDKDDNKATFYLRGGGHCNSGRYRSLDDIFKLAKYYFPGILLKEVIQELVIYSEGLESPDGADLIVSYGYCPDIRKSNFTVWMYAFYGTPFENIINKKHYNYECELKRLGFKNCEYMLYDLLE